jgi:hypothetical protein
MNTQSLADYLRNRRAMAELIAGDRGCEPEDIRWFGGMASVGATRQHPEHPGVLRDTIPIQGFANVYTVDRYDTAFDPNGFDLSGWRKNPVGFLNHNPDWPVALYDPDKAGIREGPHGVGLHVEGDILGDSEKQKEAQLYAFQRMLRTLSIGFIARKAETRELEGRQVTVFTDTDIVEIAPVTAPGNRESLFDIARAAVDGDDLQCPKCTSGPARLVRLDNLDTALRSAEAHAQDLMRRGDPEAGERVLEILVRHLTETLGCEEHGAREAKVLSAKNRGRLQDAVDLIAAVLKEADERPAHKDKDKEDEDRAVDELAMELAAERLAEDYAAEIVAEDLFKESNGPGK